MLITTGQVQGGAIEVDSPLPEGTKVIILAREDDESFELGAAEEAVILAAMTESEQGEQISALEVLQQLRTT